MHVYSIGTYEISAVLISPLKQHKFKEILNPNFIIEYNKGMGVIAIFKIEIVACFPLCQKIPERIP